MKEHKIIAILGSQGYGARYGGFETLVQNLCDHHSKELEYEYLVYNSSDARQQFITPAFTTVRRSRFKANGLQGLVFDLVTTVSALRSADVLLFLGPLPLIFAPLLRTLLRSKAKIVVNVGGLEWARPNLPYLAQRALWWSFRQSCVRADVCIFDNQYFLDVAQSNNISVADSVVIPYGCSVDYSAVVTPELLSQYSFLARRYCVSVGRSVPDNHIKELINSFPAVNDLDLVVISNFSSSEYGKGILQGKVQNNIHLIDGCYEKHILDLIRRNAMLYIHTHRNCGTAPSLIEGAIAASSVCSLDVPQNRYSLAGEGFYFIEFNQLTEFLHTKEFSEAAIEIDSAAFSWSQIASKYEEVWERC